MGKVVDTHFLEEATTNSYEVNMVVQNGCVTKDTSVILSSVNPPISVAAPKSLSSNMDSINDSQIKPPLYKQMSTQQFH